MTSELFFEGKRYIPASEAAMIGGFTGDYISRLCRDGRLTARRVGKNWFVEQSSIEAFLVDQEYHRSKRSESLSRLRAEEYRAATREPLVAAPSSAAIQHVGKVRGESQQALKKGASALIAKMQDDIRAPSRALQLIPLSQGAGAPFVEAGQKLIALTLTMTIIFGVYATVDPKAASYSMREVRDDLAAGVQAPHGLARAVLAAETHEQHVLASITARPQVAAAGIPGYFSDAAAAFAKSVARSFSTNINEFVYAIAFPEALVSSQSVVPITRSGAVSLSIEPYARATSAAITRSVATSNALPPRAVAPSARPQQKIIERVVVEQAQTQQLAQAGGITEAELDMRLNQLDNKLTSQIYALTASQSTVIAQNYAVTAQTNAINQLTNTAIANPIITGGSIANASVGATSLSVSGNANVGGNLTVVGTASFGSYNIGSIVATSSTLVDLTASYSTTTNATTTNLFASNFTLGSSTGLLEANGGVVAATSTLSVGYGGVGTSTAPTYGQLLLGNGNGGYALVSTSSLGIASAVWGNITGMLSNQTDLQNALNAKLDLSAWYSTTTDQLAEGTNHLYFTTARANTNFANNLAATTTTALAEGSNLYFTTARAQNAISVSGSPLTYASGVIGINQANGSQSGFLSSSDWTTFNSKVSSTSLSATFPLAYNSSTGAFTFSGLGTSTNLTTGQVIYASGPNTLTSISTSTPAIGSVLTYSGTLGTLLGGTSGTFGIANSAITNAMLQNSTVTINGTSVGLGTAQTITAASSTLLVDNNTFSGTNSFTNTIQGSITGNAGTVTNGVYTTTFNGLFDPRFATDLAATTTTALAEGSNLYFTTARAQNAISVSGSPLTYASGVIGINQANGSQSGFLSAGDWTAFNSKVSSTSLSATFPLAYNSATGVFSTSFSTTTNNTFSGTNTFNGALVGTGNTTLAAATSTSFAISSLSNALLSTNANGSVVATTSIGTNLLSGTLGIGQGGTNATSQTTNGVNYFNGTSITSGSNLTWNGTTFVLITPSSANAGNGIEMSSGATSTFLHINTSGSAYSPLVQQGDTQLILKGSAADSADTPGFVIAPWSGSLKGIRLDNNGNLGIGTANPAGAFETSNSYSGTSQGGEAYITNAYSSVSGTRVSDLTFRLTDSVGTKKNAAMIQALSNNQDSSTGDNLLFYTRTADAAPTEKMRLDNNGNLGIGTTIPVSNTNYGGLSLNGTSGGVFSLMTNGLETGRVQEDGNGLSINEIASLPIMLLTSDVERMRVLANGNVGIGTPTPQYNLEVHGQENVYSTTTPMTAATANQLTIREATNNPAYSLALGFFDNAGAYYSGVIQSTNAGSGSSLLLNPNGGNVGIGTTSPATKLDVFGSGGTPSLSTDNGLFQVGQTYNHLQIGADNNVPYEIWLQTKDSRNIGVSYPLSLNPLGGNVGIGTNNPASKLDVKGPDTSSTTLSFRVTDSSTNQLFAIDDSGVASVGNSSGTGDASAQFAADVNAWTIGYRSSDKAFVIASSTNLSSGAVLAIAKGGAATFSEGVVPNATNSYNLGVSGANWSCLYYNNSTLGTCASDERLKTDINDLSFDYASSTFGTASTTALEQVSQLRLRTFAYKTATSSIYEGLIAQEVLPIAPELVSTSSNGYYQLQYGSIQWLTLQALQELDANVNGIASGTTTASISPQAQSFVTNFFAGLFARLTNWFANANNGIDNLFAKNLYASNVTADTGTFGTLCVTDAAGKTCITRPQLDALLAAAGQASSGNAPTAAAGGNTSPGGITSSSTPPQLQVNGNNPATVNVGTAYADLGATITGPQGDTNLGISASVDGATSTPVSAISIDTSVAGTHTIRYSATDQQGQIGTATRTVQVVAPTAQQGSAGGGSSSVATSTASISGQAATTSAATSTAQ